MTRRVYLTLPQLARLDLGTRGQLALPLNHTARVPAEPTCPRIGQGRPQSPDCEPRGDGLPAYFVDMIGERR